MELGTLCTTVASPEASGIYTELWGVPVIPYGYSKLSGWFLDGCLSTCSKGPTHSSWKGDSVVP